MNETPTNGSPPASPGLAPGMSRALEALRQNLLDVGKRNKLINSPIDKNRGKQLSVVDELSDEVFKILYLQGKKMTFAASSEEQDDSLDEASEAVYLPPDEDGSGAEVAVRHLDRTLQTKLTRDRLQKQLLGLYRDARTLEEEQGVSVLFLALGFLRWYESESSDHERHAPLILLPVDLERDSVRGRFRLSARDQDMDANLSLRALLESDFGLTLPDLPDGADWLPSDYYGLVAAAASSRSRWRVLPNAMELSFYSFAKFLMWKDLAPGADQDGEPGSDVLERLLVGGFESGPSIFAPDENLDRRFPDPKDLGHILDADTSQTQVIAAARSGRSLVVQGPPGTGKSQTIANVIAGAAMDGKKVLFIAEKRAALDVVHARLVKCGIGPLCLELHSHKANRRHVYEELKRTLDLGPPLDVNEEQYERVRQVRDDLNRTSALLHAVDEATGETAFGVIGQLAELAEGDCPRPEFRIAGAGEWSRDDFGERLKAVGALAALTSEHGSERQHAWRGARKRLTQLDRERLLGWLRDGIGLLDAVEPPFSAGSRAASIHRPPSVAAAAEVAEYLDALRQMPPGVPGLLESEAVLQEPQAVLALCESVESAQVLAAELRETVVESALEVHWDDVRLQIAQRGRSLFRWLSGSYRQAVGRLRSVQRAQLAKGFDERLALLDRLLEHRRLVRGIARDSRLGQDALGRAWREEETDLGPALPALRWIAAQERKLGGAARLREQVDAAPPDADLAALADDLRQAAAAWTERWNEIARILDLDPEEAFGASAVETVGAAILQARLGDWIAAPNEIEGWHRLASAARHVSELGLEEFRDRLADGRLSPDYAAESLDFVRAEAVWNRLRDTEPRLESIDGEERSRKVEVFKRLDQQLQSLAAQEIVLRHFRSLPPGAAGQVGVIRGEVAKKTRHMKLRQLLDKAGEAVAAIKPVFLMSPLSVAQYLTPGGLTFDLLLIDEASQVRPADAMGAIMRCRQVVVVGDQKQMPPTSFFDRQVASEEPGPDLDDIAEIQAAQVGDMESILSLCESRAMAGGMLRWHYRSQHPSLIEVSNHEFYDNDLICPPSPQLAGRGIGLSFVHVDAQYERGKKRNNPKEADAVAEEVLAHARKHPDESLGVVALSVSQRDTIQNKIEFLRAEHPELEAFCKEGKDEAFFVKNLENVQGDERDVIFISIGYGKDAGGYMSQNFGPVSSEGGERRLNVLFTRSRKRCRVFSSIRQGDIRVDTTKHAGPRVLKRYLKYAETGELDIPVLTGAEMDSPFEEAVAKALHGHGYRVAAQVGSSGFRIDLAVYDPDDEGRFLLAVECDGARYHSSRWARERDRLRQIVLEQKGWTFHRIWSTDWFYSRDSEMAKLLDALDRARSADAAVRAPAPVPAAAEVERAQPEPAPEQERAAYVEADFSIDSSSYLALHEAPPAVVGDAVVRIVEVEGPVHVDEVSRRLARLWGYQRTGSRIQAVAEEAVRAQAATGRIGWSDGAAQRFLDIGGRAGTLGVRDRREVRSQSLRKLEMLPPSEIRAGILDAVRRNVGIDLDDCASEVARMFGVRPGRSAMRACVESHAGELVGEGALVRVRGELRVGGPER